MRVIVSSRIEREPFVAVFIFILESLGIEDWYSYDRDTYARRIAEMRPLSVDRELTDMVAEIYGSGAHFELLESYGYSADEHGFAEWIRACAGETKQSDICTISVSSDEESDKQSFYKFLAGSASELAGQGGIDSHKLAMGYATLYGQARGWLKTGSSVTVDQSQRVIMNEAGKALENAKDVVRRIQGKSNDKAD